MTNDEQHARVDGKLDYIIEKVDRVDDAIFGNGQPGLKVQVAKHGQTLTVFKRIVWGVLSIVATIAGGLALAAIL